MTNATATSLMPLSVLDDDAPAECRNLYNTRLWRVRITQAGRGEFPWTARGKH